MSHELITSGLSHYRRVRAMCSLVGCDLPIAARICDRLIFGPIPIRMYVIICVFLVYRWNSKCWLLRWPWIAQRILVTKSNDHNRSHDTHSKSTRICFLKSMMSFYTRVIAFANSRSEVSIDDRSY